MWIATAEESRRLDEQSQIEFGVSPAVLMERAGLAVFEALKQMLGESGSLSVLCGRGNNGGDGFVVARLAVEHGYRVDCLVAAREEDLRPEAHAQMLQARAQGVHPVFSDDARYARRLECLACKDLLVDGLLGIGAQGDVREPVLTAVKAINRSGVPVLAIDVPSGIHTDTGEELGESVWALRTVTFGRPKPFLFQGIGLEHSGYWSVADIGFPGELLRQHTSARLVDREFVAGQLPERLRASHKGSNGHVLIVAGSRAMRGAAVLAAKAAMRAGAGLVTVASVDPVIDAIAGQLPEALLLPLPEIGGVVSPSAAEAVLANKHNYHAALFGPGLTHEQPAYEFLQRLWSQWTAPCVIDADAINAVGLGLDLPDAPCVLTPHPGEMSRLLRSSIAEVQADRLSTARASSDKLGQTVLLKGPYSIVSAPDEPIFVNTTGNPGMASAGMGDVLAGLMTTLLGQEVPTLEAAVCAAYWHGAAGDLCAERRGRVGFLASDVAEALPEARRRVLGDEA